MDTFGIGPVKKFHGSCWSGFSVWMFPCCVRGIASHFHGLESRVACVRKRRETNSNALKNFISRAVSLPDPPDDLNYIWIFAICNRSTKFCIILDYRCFSYFLARMIISNVRFIIQQIAMNCDEELFVTVVKTQINISFNTSYVKRYSYSYNGGTMHVFEVRKCKNTIEVFCCYTN